MNFFSRYFSFCDFCSVGGWRWPICGFAKDLRLVLGSLMSTVVVIVLVGVLSAIIDKITIF